MLQHRSRLIYDVGMNNGDDSLYYLRKGYRVVAIEANAELCARASARFESEIKHNQITILNIGVGNERGSRPFYVHNLNSVLSTFVPEGERIGFTAKVRPDEFSVRSVEIRKLSDVVNFFGHPDYIKIDVEGWDAACLRDLYETGIRPPSISAEVHSIDVFCFLVAMGYTEFNMVAGITVAVAFANHTIRSVDGTTSLFSFNEHSAGPFGDDLPGPWVGSEAILQTWLRRGDIGWFDIHARLPR